MCIRDRIPPTFDEDNYKVKLPITKRVVELSYLKANSIKTNCEIKDKIIQNLSNLGDQN